MGYGSISCPGPEEEVIIEVHGGFRSVGKASSSVRKTSNKWEVVTLLQLEIGIITEVCEDSIQFGSIAKSR